MLRFQQLTTFGIAALLVVPAATLQEGDRGGLQNALDRTVGAIDGLRGLEGALASGETGIVERLLASTQAPQLDAPARDARLDELRGEVSRLRQHLDELLAGRAPTFSPATHGHGGDAGASEGPDGLTRPTSSGAPHTGLEPGELDSLRDVHPPVPGETPEALLAAQPRTFEVTGFSADPVLHGRAYFRAGRYEEALKLLEARPEDHRARYWTARCLERLGRTDQALERYRAVAELAGSLEDDPELASLAERAAHDVEFLEWKTAFDLRLRRLTPPDSQ